MGAKGFAGDLVSENVSDRAPIKPYEGFETGDRVRGRWDLGTVRAVGPDGLVLVEFDETDAAGVRRTDIKDRLAWRESWTLTEVPLAPPGPSER
jgi:hypothetical protein